MRRVMEREARVCLPSLASGFEGNCPYLSIKFTGIGERAGEGEGEGESEVREKWREKEREFNPTKANSADITQ